jgi:hypothetical protein
MEKGKNIILDAKTDYPVACNVMVFIFLNISCAKNIFLLFYLFILFNMLFVTRKLFLFMKRCCKMVMLMNFSLNFKLKA